MELKRIWEILWRRKWIAIQAFLVVSLAAIGGTQLLTPIYQTTARILVEEQGAASSLLETIGMRELSDIMPASAQSVDMKTRVTLCRSTPVLNEVIHRLQVRDANGDLLLAGQITATARLLQTVFPRPHVDVAEDRESSTLSVTATAVDPDQAMFLANTLAEVYIEESQSRRKREILSARRFIEAQLEEVRGNYYRALEDINAFQKNQGSVDLATESRIALEKWAELMKQKEDNVIDIAQVKAKRDALKEQLTASDPSSTFSLASKDDESVRNLKRSLISLNLRLIETLTEKTPKHPDVLALQEQIREAESGLAEQLNTYSLFSPELLDMERQLASLTAHLEGVNTVIARYERQLKSVPDRILSETKLKSKLDVIEKIYDSLLDYRYKVAVAEAMTVSDVQLIQTAPRPLVPVKPNNATNAVLGLFLGAVFGLSLAFFWEYLDDTIKTPEDLKGYESIGFLGMIPAHKGLRTLRDLTLIHPVAEAYRTLRNNLRFASVDRPLKILVITSCFPDEGKTTMVANLGISFGLSGSKVLLVDTDLRNPTLHRLFNMPNEVGLSNLLTGERKVSEAIVKIGARMSLLPSGPTPPNPAGLVESKALTRLLELLKERYDIVVLDSPPLLLNNDAAILGTLADGLIGVVDSGRTSRQGLAHYLETLGKANIRSLGVVINKLKIERSGYYYYGRYYKKPYYASEEKSA